ncbi:MAG: hypothetical protein M1833_005404 [Piccolia ochrophora]|nr:MAG: hypothetical protein M1833_005404 [Piccolia ochrophora]
MELIRRPREDSDVSIEEVQRDFPPGGGYGRDPYRDDRPRRRARSLERDRGYGYGDNGDARYSESNLTETRSGRGRHRDGKDSRGRSLSRPQEIAAAAAGAGLAVGSKELWDRRDGGKHRHRSKSRLGQAALGVAGAVAGDVAAKQWSKRQGRERDGDRKERVQSYGAVDPDGRYYNETQIEYDERPKHRPSRRKSVIETAEKAVGALGLGTALKEFTGGDHDRDRDRDRDRNHRRHRRYSDSSESGYSRSRSRSRGRGGDNSKKMQQAAQAALTAAAAEAWRSRKEPGGYFQGEKARRILTAAAGAGGINALADKSDSHGDGNVGKGAIGGVLLNRFVNGPRGEDDGHGGRRARSHSRSRSRSRGGTLKDLGAAGLAAGAAKKFLDSRSKSKSRDRRYSSSSDSRSPQRPRRSRSVSAFIDRGMNKIGLGDGEEPRSDRDRDRRHQNQGRASRDDAYYGGGTSRDVGHYGGGTSRDVGRPRSERRGSSSSSASSEFSLEDEERSRRKMKGKELLTAGLASIATVHAGHGIYQSWEAREARRKAVLNGEMTPNEAKKKKANATAKDAFSVGLAVLGVKGAVGEWKEMRGQEKEYKEFKSKVKRHRQKAAERQARPQPKQQQSGYGSTDRWRHSAPNLADGAAYGGGPHYQDGNPYASGGGYSDSRRRH